MTQYKATCLIVQRFPQNMQWKQNITQFYGSHTTMLTILHWYRLSRFFIQYHSSIEWRWMLEVGFVNKMNMDIIYLQLRFNPHLPTPQSPKKKKLEKEKKLIGGKGSRMRNKKRISLDFCCHETPLLYLHWSKLHLELSN